jgi:hypothetical protein
LAVKDTGLERAYGRPLDATPAQDAAKVAYLETDGVLPMTARSTTGRSKQRPYEPAGPLASNLHLWGDIRLHRGDLPGARAAYEEALDITRRIVDRHGDTPRARGQLQRAEATLAAMACRAFALTRPTAPQSPAAAPPPRPAPT